MCDLRVKLYAINFFFVFSIIVNLELFVEAIILKFLGSFTTASSWLIQTDFLVLRYLFVKSELFS